MSHRGRLGILIVAAAGVGAAEWLRQPAMVLVWLAWICVLAEAILLWPLAGWRRRGLLLLLAALAAVMTLGHRQLRAIETRWPEERESRVTA
ncbi:MAG: hypothetical protein ACJ8AM_08630, partial [Gemmatimonadales bacterium]